LTGDLPAPVLSESCAEAGVIADDADVVLREDVAVPGGNGDRLEIDFCAGCIETVAHILPDASQIRDRGAVADNCCFSGRDSGVAPGDGDTAAPDAELAGARTPTEEVEAAAGAEPVRRLPVTMHISPEESQIKEFVTVEFPGGDAAFVVEHSLGDPDDWAIATGLHIKTNPAAIMPHNPLKLSILLSPPPAAHILNRLGRWSIILCGVCSDFCTSPKPVGAADRAGVSHRCDLLLRIRNHSCTLPHSIENHNWR